MANGKYNCYCVRLRTQHIQQPAGATRRSTSDTEASCHFGTCQPALGWRRLFAIAFNFTTKRAIAFRTPVRLTAVGMCLAILLRAHPSRTRVNLRWPNQFGSHSVCCDCLTRRATRQQCRLGFRSMTKRYTLENGVQSLLKKNILLSKDWIIWKWTSLHYTFFQLLLNKASFSHYWIKILNNDGLNFIQLRLNTNSSIVTERSDREKGNQSMESNHQGFILDYP